jgi:hypothetical protein
MPPSHERVGTSKCELQDAASPRVTGKGVNTTSRAKGLHDAGRCGPPFGGERHTLRNSVICPLFSTPHLVERAGGDMTREWAPICEVAAC